ncbi:hypothetical protein [Nonomuraea dietziae]|uniref:Uncharacterized protein n=1 Tax=Nonomuraea dietziae TaxID=65515 RepID=A0A7W5V1V2_9ACTN|nr:hypothetical protein [Nonomuraea dietziae]MBB3726176.1 hypothetical protein [Nonomuraea dietziae]
MLEELFRSLVSDTHARTTVKFDYRYVCGTTTLMERVPLSRRRPETNSETADALPCRIEQVLKTGETENFIAFCRVPEQATEEDLLRRCGLRVIAVVQPIGRRR